MGLYVKVSIMSCTVLNIIAKKLRYGSERTGFSVAFGSSAGANVELPEARTPKGGQGHAPPPPLREICKIGLSKMQFPAFPGPELGNRNYDRNHLFFFDCMHYITK